MTETLSAQKSKKIVQILYGWHLKYYTDDSGCNQLATHMKSFVSNALPDVIFYICCGAKSKTEFAVAVSKNSPKPAKAMIKILVEQQEMVIETNAWTNSCIFYNIPCCIKNGQNYKFSCEIIWEGFHNTKSSSFDLPYHIERYLTEPDFSDLVIRIDDNEIPVHKLILGAYSPVFLAMLKTDMTESAKNEIVVEDIEFDIMKKVIKFMYSGTINSELPVDDLLSIIYVADKYEIMDLKDLCEGILISKITIYSVFKIFEHAHLCGAYDVVFSAITFMKKNKYIIIQSEDFMKLYRTKSELLSDLFIENIAECSE